METRVERTLNPSFTTRKTSAAFTAETGLQILQGGLAPCGESFVHRESIQHIVPSPAAASCTADPRVARQVFIMCTGLLVAIGTLMVYSSSMTSRPTDFEQIYLSRHLCFLALAYLAGVICASLPATFWKRASPVLFTCTILLLLAVMVPGIGTRVNGAQRWIRLSGISIQPSETAKITIPLLMAASLTKSSKGYFGEIVRLLAPMVAACILIAQEPDLGTATFVGMTGVIALFLSRWPIQNFLIGGLAAFPAAILLVAMKPYQLERIEGFIAVWNDFAQAPYQIRQSLTTLGTGGYFGTGLGTGWQKLSFLPEANTDFVFAVIGEELGLAATLSVICLWLTFLFSGLKVLNRLPRDSFAWIAGMTLLVQVVLQAAVNVAVVTAMLPPKGISHPLISYGGSNLLVTISAVGIILSLSRGEESLSDDDDAEFDEDLEEDAPEWNSDEFDDEELAGELTGSVAYE